MARHKDTNWNLEDAATTPHAQLALLMDIRDELKTLNRILNCPNFLEIPWKLEQIRRNTAAKKRKQKAPEI